MAGIHDELEPEVKISLTESWIVASHRPAEHTRVSNEHKLSRHLRVESVEAHKAGIDTSPPSLYDPRGSPRPASRYSSVIHIPGRYTRPGYETTVVA